MKIILLSSFLWVSQSLLFSQSACFSSANDYVFQGPTNGQSLEKGDFDNDGKTDIVIANFTVGTNRMNFIKGNGDGTFQPPMLFEGGSRPVAVKAGDFNGDGKLDMAVANFSAATLSIIFGNGNGTFAAPVTYTTNPGPFDIDTADFNGDGTTDIVVSANSGFNLFFGSTATPGTFTGGVYTAMSSGARGILAGDLNHDGKTDVATANQSTSSVSVRLGDGLGGFLAVTSYGTAAGCFAVTAGDYDNDGDMDLAASNETGDNISVLLNTGAGAYAAAINYPAGDGPNGIITQDLNGDGKPDLAVINSLQNTMSVYIGSGNGTFLPQQQHTVIGTPRDLVAGTFNADGFPDIAISTSIGSVMPVLLGNGSGTFASAISVPTGNNPKTIDHADYNGDGKQDVVVANSTDNTFSFFAGLGTGNFAAGTTFATQTLPVSIYSGDVNNDGKTDVVTANSTANSVSVFLGDGTGNFAAAVNFSCNAAPNFVRLADLNNDGNQDLIVINTANQFSVLQGTGTGAFGAPVAYTTGTTPVALVIKNFNGDAFKDVIVVNSGNNNVGVFLNSGTGTFGTGVVYPVGTAPSAIDAGDFNGDGSLDIAVTNYTTNNISRLLNNGSGVFGTAVTYTSGDSGPKGIVAEDFNNDGKTDLMTINFVTAGSTGYASVLIGNGAGAFTFYKRFATGIKPLGIIAADFNNDGRKDVAAVNETSETFSVLMNTTAQVTASGPTTFCSGNSVVLQAASSPSYSWSNGITTQSNTITTSGSYTLTTNESVSNWCTSTSPAIAVTVTPGPATPTVTAGGPLTFCSGGNVVLTSSSATNNTWSNGATTQSITVSASGSYSVTFSSGGCTSSPSTPVVVTVSAVPTITASGPTTFCTGGSVVLTSSETTGNIWSTGETTQSITVTASGSYTVSNTVGGCPTLTSAPVVITVGSLPTAPTITASGPTTFCAGGNVVLTSSLATNNVWSNGATTQSITVSTPGSYTVYTNNGGCSSPLSPATVVTVNPLPPTPAITASGPTTFCTGGNVTLTSSSATSNVWSTGVTTQSITVSASGNYSVTVTDNGCSAASVATAISVNPLPPTPAITASGPTTFCTGGNVTLTSSSATSNVWSTGETTQSITVSVSGNYSVEVIENGCTSGSSAVKTITVNPIPALPTITASGVTSFCSGNDVVLTSSSATNNLWSTGETTQSITVSVSGNYSVEVIENGCTSGSSAVKTITVNPIPALPTITASGPTTFCSGNNVVLTSSSATNNLWSTGETTQSITITTSGSYSVEVIENGCTSGSSAAETVTVNPTPAVPTITTSGSTTFCAGDSIVLTSSAVSGNVWSTGETTQSITVLTSGSYSVVETTGLCTSASSIPVSVTVNPIPALPTITASGVTTFCSGNDVVLTSSSATNNLWSTGETTQSITVSTSGTYTVEVIENGCTSGSSAAETVTVNPTPAVPTITASGSTTFCAGDSIVLTSSAASGNSWSTGETTQSITITTPGSYSVVETTGLCTSASSIPVSVTVNPIPALPTITASGVTTFCSGSDVVLTSSSATDNLWSTGETTQSITITTSGSYSVEVIESGCTSGSSAAETVTVNPTPAVPTITTSGSTTFCAGDSVVLTSSAVSGNSWSTGETTQSITVLASGSYSVAATTGLCTSASSIPVSVTVNPIPALPTITASGPTTFCSGNDVVLTSSSATNNLWSTGETTQSITITTSGSYSVEVIESGCTSGSSAAETVTVNPTPAVPTITTSGSTTFCAGDSIVLTSSAVSGNVWSTGETTQSITVLASDSYSVAATTGLCTSASSIPVSVTVNPIPALPTITASGPTTFCTGGNVTLTSSSATSNVWSTGETTQSITVSASGNYTVEVIESGCTSGSSAAETVTVNPTPAVPTITASGPTTFCDGDSVVLTSSAASGNSWSTGETTQSITVLTSGSYSVVETTGLCTSASSIVVPVTMNPIPVLPTIVASGPTTFCSGSDVVLTSSSATDNLWSTGETTQSITITTSGSYSVEVIENGCTSGSSIAEPVTVNPTPAVPTITASGPTTFCAGDSIVLTSSAVSGNVWSNGATTQSITVLASGSYSVAATTGLCTSASSIVVPVTVNPIPVLPTIVASGLTTFCSGNDVVLTSSSATDNLWSTGETTQSITVSTSGTYTVEVIENGCTSGSSIAEPVTVNPTPAVPTITASGSTTFCDGDSVILTSSAVSGNVWSTGETTQSITVLASGSYSVEETTGLCTSASSIVVPVTVNPIPVLPTIVASGPTTFCSGNSVILISSVASGNVWSTGETAQFIIVSVSGSYSVENIANGCSSGSSIAETVTVNPMPAVPTITASGPTTFCAGDSIVLTSSAVSGNVWSNGATTQSITVLASGSYSVAATTGLCTSASSIPVSVTVNPIPALPTITASGPTTFCSGNNVVLTSSSPLYNHWSNGATTQSITVAASGNYSVEVISGGCFSGISAVETITVNPTPLIPVITAGGLTVFCDGLSVVLTSSSASGNTWSTGETTQSITVTTSGTYTVSTGTGSCNSGISLPTIVLVNPAPSTPVITALGPTTFCNGGSVTLTSSSLINNHWSNGATTPSITVSASGTYSLYVSNGSCNSNSATVTVTVNPVPAMPAITASGPTTFCNGGTVTLTSSAATGNVWSTGATTQSITVSASGSYSVYENGVCPSPASAATVVTVNPVPAMPAITASGPTTFCAGGTVTLTSSASTGNVWSTGATTQSITVSASGSYSVYENGVCPSPASAAAVVTVNPVPAMPTITASGPTTFCAGGTVTLTSSAATGNVWSTGATTQSITVSASGSYSVYENGVCPSPASAATVVTVNPVPAMPAITASGPTTFCNGGTVTLTSSAATGNVWSTGATTQSITVSASGSYSVYENGVCPSPASAATVVTVNPVPAMPAITASGPTTFCAGGTVTLTSSAATGNVWSTGATTQSITVSASGTYALYVSNGSCNSDNAIPVAVTVNPVPASPTMLTGTTGSFCAGDSMVLTSSATGGNAWSTGETTQSITVTTAGTYTVSVVNGFGCYSAASASATISVIALPTAPVITAGGPVTFCAGGSVTLTSSSPSNNSWSTGAITPSITVSAPGTYSVAYANAGGCLSSSSAPVTVTVNALPAAPVITADGPTSICSGSSVTLTSSAAGGNLWSTGAGTSSLAVSANGSYTVSYTDANGCASPASAPAVITILPNPAAPAIIAGGPTTFCAGGSVVLTSSSPTGNTWSNGELTQAIAASAAGAYTVTYTNSDGCSATSLPITVSLLSLPSAPLITANPSMGICPGETTTLTSSGTNNSWSTGETTSSITVSAAGNYSVTTSNGGCTSLPAEVTVTLSPVPAVPVITTSGPLAICAGDEVFLFTSSNQDDEWSTSETAQVIGVSTAGSYTVTTTNTYGCSATSLPVEVTVRQLPVVTIGAFDPLCSYENAFVPDNAAPAGGAYSGDGLSNGLFDPQAAGVGAFIITYAYTDTNGCTNTAQATITVEDCAAIAEAEAGSFTVYPNPSFGNFTIASPLSNIEAVKVYDAAGKLIADLRFEGSPEVQLDLTPFADGVYHAEVLAGGITKQVRLVVNK